MKLPRLNIGGLSAKIPIIQGGMAVRVSTAPLAAAVANEGAIGIIAATGMTESELKGEIQQARVLSSGIIGINCLFAARNFASLVQTAIQEKIDLVISGAGFSRDMFRWGEKSGTPIVPVVSSVRVAKLAEKSGAAAVVVEGKEAGGHLGTDEPLMKILSSIKSAVQIPVIAAGGIVNGADIHQAIQAGADGVQMGTRFAASTESGANRAFKELYLKAQAEDVVLIKSPVGLPGRALRNAFWERWAKEEDLSPEACQGCLKKCSGDFCILDALEKARDGDMEQGLVFAGEGIGKISKILSVQQIFQQLQQEIQIACS